MIINTKLKEYIEKNIFPIYKNNDLGHDLEHITYVINRSIKFASTIPNINYDMVFVIAAYHDLGHHIDAKKHEKVSSEMLLADENLKEYFTEEEIIIMSEAICDHRASLEYEPRSIYGKIVSSADRNISVDIPLRRTYEYRVNHDNNYCLSEIIKQSRHHLQDKFGEKGYANEKMYFEDTEYKEFLENTCKLTKDEDLFIKHFLRVNNIDQSIYKTIFERLKKSNSVLSLDELLYETYLKTRIKETDGFDKYRNLILEANNINELEYYTKEVNPKLKEYINNYVFPQYKENDGAHGIVHIVEVIRRSFALNDTFKLGLDPNMIYAIAAYHDFGKHEDHKNHHLIAAKRFIKDNNMREFFNDKERIIIKDAIEDHRSSKDDDPRSTYGKLVSSADRNTSIDIVFIRSFFVAKERMPETNIEDYLDYTIERLSKKYDEENPENMFYEDRTYLEFIKDMRLILKQEEVFKNRYCAVNHITSRDNTVGQEQGDISYINSLEITGGKMIYQIGLLCKHFKGTDLYEKNIYRIERLNVRGNEMDENLITYTGDGILSEATNLVVYSNIFQDNKLFAREYEDISSNLSSEKQELYNQTIKVEPLTEEETKLVLSSDFAKEKQRLVLKKYKK